MATCPYCLGPLTDSHQCPKKRRAGIFLQLGSTFGGAAAAFVVMALVDPDQNSRHLDIWVIAGGALIGALACQALVARR